jgi:serine/threonine protein kinase
MLRGAIFADRFVIEAEAGAGGMGRVYSAVDRIGGEIVALKVLSAEDGASVERFSREAQVLSKLSHPGVVRYVDHGVTAEGKRYIAMEWLEGESLSQRLSRQPLTLAESVQVTRRVAEALSEAHRIGIVHRDIKPSNIFVVGGDIARVKLLDFGIARRLRDDVAVTRTGMLVGSWAYMAPEQALGSKDVDARRRFWARMRTLRVHHRTPCVSRRELDGGAREDPARRPDAARSATRRRACGAF